MYIAEISRSRPNSLDFEIVSPTLKFRAETSVNAIQENCGPIRVRGRSHLGGGQTAGKINPVVYVERWMAHSQLRGGKVLKTFEDNLFHVRFPIAVKVQV